MNRFQLKVLMLLLMVIDHIGWFIPNTPIWFNYIGRLVAPVFLFLLVDGYYHTSNRYDYAKRLVVAAGVMTTGNLIISLFFFMEDKKINPVMYLLLISVVIALAFLTLNIYRVSAYNKKRILLAAIAFALTPFLFYDILAITNNIFLPMGLSIMLLDAMEEAKMGEDKVSSILRVLGILSITVLTEGSLMIPFMVIIFYYFNVSKKLLCISYILLSLLMGINGLSYQDLFLYNYQWMMVFALPFFFVYNGEKGRDIRYLFYSFYPLHIWILYIVGGFIEAKMSSP